MKRLNIIYLFFIYIPLSICLCNCGARPEPKITNKMETVHADTSNGKYVWTELTDKAAFPKGYNFQLFSVKDTLWALHHTGTWFSIDGKQWTKNTLTNIIKNNGFLDYV